MKLKNTLIATALVFGSVVVASAQTVAPTAAAEVAPAAPQFTPLQALEAYGWHIGKNTGLADLSFTQEEVDALIRGMMLAREGKELPYNVEQIGPELDKLMRTKQEAYVTKMKQEAAAEANKLMAEVKARPGVVALPSGVVYEVLKPGTGAYPKVTDTVKIHYKGTLVNGKVFDTSLEPRQPGAAVEPAEFPLDRVVPGFSEGVQKINQGGKIKLYIPPALGYGDNGTPNIPPGSTLIFEVELIEIKAPVTPETPAPAAVK